MNVYPIDIHGPLLYKRVEEGEALVTCTHDKLVLRVEFDAPFTADRDQAEGSIVCFLRASDDGIDIFYSHHIFRYRAATAGAFQQETYSRIALTPALRSWIDHCCMLEFWSTMLRRVQTSPEPPDQYANLLQFDGHVAATPYDPRKDPDFDYRKL